MRLDTNAWGVGRHPLRDKIIEIVHFLCVIPYRVGILVLPPADWGMLLTSFRSPLSESPNQLDKSFTGVIVWVKSFICRASCNNCRLGKAGEPCRPWIHPPEALL